MRNFFLASPLSVRVSARLYYQKGTLIDEKTTSLLHRLRCTRQAQKMKKASLYVAGIVLFIGAVYVWRYRSDLSFVRDWLPTRSAEGLLQGRLQPLDWKPIDESNQGFKLEMPGEPKQTVVQATTEAGTTEPVNMLLVKPDTDRTYAIAWADKPPVARMSDLVPDRTLDQAREGALSRTSTTLVTESRNTPQGFPGRDIVSHNAGGGVLDTRFIYAGTRLYMLIATSPSASARRQDEVNHFFNSFTIASNSQIPETIPAATQ